MVFSASLINSSASNGSQVHLERVLKTLFPGQEIITNARKESRLKNPETGNYFEVDIWIPNQHLCFEFQDIHHYSTSWYHQRPLDEVKASDAYKRNAIQQTGSTLIHVPYWWDLSEASVAATISFERPDAITSSPYEPIALNPPDIKIQYIPEVGELMYASFPTVFVSDIITEDNSWWLGEKYDGVRACWNSKRKLMFARYGNILDLPLAFSISMPPLFLDTEIWFGRGFYNEAAGIRGGLVDDWSFLRILTFDKPDIPTQMLPFEKRYKYLVRQIPSHHQILILAPRIKCKNLVFLGKVLGLILAEGGEGIICRKIESEYEQGRSELLWKLKAAKEDREALVVSVEEDKSCLLQLPDGMTFHVASPALSLKRGDIVTFTFDFYSGKSVPVNPVISRKRSDMSWDDVIREYEKENKSGGQALSLNKASTKLHQQKPMNYWNANSFQNVRLFFENFARKRGKDPLIPDSWYSAVEDLTLQKEAGAILTYFNGSFVRALKEVFPNIGLVETKFDHTPKSFWNTSRMREYIEQFARENEFDPLIDTNWYNMSPKILDSKELRAIRARFSSSIPSMLIHLFPEIGLKKKNFVVMPRGVQERRKLRKEFLKEFAARNHFDPLVPENWYSVYLDTFLSKRSSEARSLLKYYYGSLVKAVMDLFPNIGLIESKFSVVPRGFLTNKNNRRKILEQYAKDSGLDPLSPRTWYSVSFDSVSSYKGARSVLNLYKGSLTTALLDLFPDIGLNCIELPVLRNHWSVFQNQRNFFIEFAKSLRFDPLVAKNWYYVSNNMLSKKLGSHSVLKRHGGSLSKALIDTFPEVKFDERKFLRRNTVKNVSYRRDYFVNFARSRGFDPLIAANWYKISPQLAFSEPQGSTIMKQYTNLSSALVDLFPNIHFDVSKFISR